MPEHLGQRTKAARDTKKFTIDWSSYLRTGATISSASTPSDLVPAGITVSSTTSDSTTTTQTISGGRVGQTFEIICQVVTSDSETLLLQWTLVIV